MVDMYKFMELHDRNAIQKKLKGYRQPFDITDKTTRVGKNDPGRTYVGRNLKK